MNEPNKHRRAEPKRAARPARSLPPVLAWLRTAPGMIVFAVVVIGTSFLVRALVTDDDTPATGHSVPGVINGTYGTQWTTVDGSAYEISIETLNDLGQGESGSGCLPAPPAGTANLSFRIVVTNKSDKDVDVPRVDFGTDLTQNGGVDPGRQAFAKSNKALEIGPLPPGVPDCKGLARIGPERGQIPVGGIAEFRGTFGPIKVPAKTVPTVVYRYYAGDNGKAKPAVLLAPFVKF